MAFEKLKEGGGEHSLPRARFFRWCILFLKHREYVKDEHRSERPSTPKTDENIGRVNTVVKSDHRLTLKTLKI